MHRLLLLVLALIVLGIEILMGSRAFFPELFENRSSGVEDILADKENILKQLSPEDLAYVSKNPVVTVGVDPNFYPLEMFDERGRYTGLGGDYIKILSKMTGLTFKPIALDDWATTEGEANRGMIDMFMVAAQRIHALHRALHLHARHNHDKARQRPGQYQRKGPGRQEGGGCGRLFLARLS